MPNADGTGNAWDGLKNIGLALIYFLLLYCTDRYLGGKLAIMMIVGGAGGAALGFLAGKDLKAVVAWGAIGVLAGLGFWAAL